MLLWGWPPAWQGDGGDVYSLREGHATMAPFACWPGIWQGREEECLRPEEESLVGIGRLRHPRSP